MTKGTRQVIRDLVVRSLVIAVGLGLLLPHSAAIASSDPCTHGNHQIWLTSGGASPGSGTTSTAFTFSVTLTDSAQKSCSPSVTVTVVGAGTFTLSPPTGANYQAGVVFRVSRTLPVGTHAYNFAVKSGTGSGATSATLMQVTPTSVVVSAQPTPSATPKPSPKPTPAPTARPTPSKAPTAATTAAPKATKKPKASTSSKPKATVMPRPTPASL